MRLAARVFRSRSAYLCSTGIAMVLACAASASAQLRLVPYVSGFNAPLEFVQDPAVAARQYVVEQGGRIRVIQDGVVQPTPFLDLSAAIENVVSSASRCHPTIPRPAVSS